MGSDTRKIYEKYIADGPDTLTLDQTREALAFPEREPQVALEVRLRLEAEKREAASEELARQTWLRQGGDASQFLRAYRELSADRRKEAMAAAGEAARSASFRRMREGF